MNNPCGAETRIFFATILFIPFLRSPNNPQPTSEVKTLTHINFLKLIQNVKESMSSPDIIYLQTSLLHMHLIAAQSY